MKRCTKYKHIFNWIVLLTIFCVLSTLVYARGRGGGGRGGGFGAASRGSGSRFGGGSWGSRRTSWGNSRAYSRPYGGASYRRSYGGFTGRRTSSSTGFGIGLGRGLLIGYGFGLMTRPVRYRRAPSQNNYDAYKKPLHCAFANSTLYFKVGSSSLNLDVDESKKECDPDMDTCYGFMTMISANFTKGSGTSSKIVTIYELKVEKGCGKKTEIMENINKEGSQYSKNEVCWNTNLMNAEMSKDPESKLGYRISDQVEFCSSDQPSSCKISQNAVNSSSSRLIFEVDLKKRYFSKDKDVRINAERIPVKLQREDCLCDWRLCNKGRNGSGNIYIILMSISLLIISVVM